MRGVVNEGFYCTSSNKTYYESAYIVRIILLCVGPIL